MIQQYAQMRQVEYKAPQRKVELSEITEAEDVDAMNDIVLLGALKEVWSEEVKGYVPYTHIVRLFDGALMWHYLVVRK